MAVHQLQTKNSSSFVEWIPDNVSVTSYSVPPVGQKQAGVCLANTTSLQELLKRTHVQMMAMFRRRAYLHMYTTTSGVDEMEFMEAESNTMDLMCVFLVLLSRDVWLMKWLAARSTSSTRMPVLTTQMRNMSRRAPSRRTKRINNAG